MDPVERFDAYAAAFEIVVEKDDWSILEPFFTEDAIYEIFGGPPFEGRHDGRAAVFTYLEQSLSGFDRRFDTRELEMLEGTLERDGAAWTRWRVTYRVADAPPLVVNGEEIADFEGDRIRRLVDHFAEGAGAAALSWLGEHGAKLRPA